MEIESDRKTSPEKKVYPHPAMAIDHRQKPVCAYARMQRKQTAVVGIFFSVHRQVDQQQDHLARFVILMEF